MATSLFNVAATKVIFNTNCTCKILQNVVITQSNIRFYSSYNQSEQSKKEINIKIGRFTNFAPSLYRKYIGKMPPPRRLNKMIFKDNEARKEFLRKLYATYGSESGVNPQICWPSKEELKVLKADEKELEPTLQELLANLKEEKKNDAKFRKELQSRVEKNMEKMDGLVKAFKEKKRKNYEKNEEAERKKIELLDDAEEHFGYRVHAKSDEFKSFLQTRKDQELKTKKELKKLKNKALISEKISAAAKK